jgi:hypothetical protein
MIGLHILMCLLAQHRTGHDLCDGLTEYDGPATREQATLYDLPASREYWAIWDRLDRGERP